MDNAKLFNTVKHRWEEITALPTQNVGPLTPLYKRTVPFLKTYPWRVLGVGAFLVTCALYLTLGPLLVRLVSLLQRGF